MRLNISFDLDGVLVDYHSCLKEYLKSHIGVDMVSTGKFHFDTDPEIPYRKLDKAIYRAMDYTERIDPMDGARLVLATLHELTGDPITIVTARPKNKIVETVASIDRVLGDIPYLLAMVDSGSDKHRYVRVRCFIDDRRRTAIEMASRGYWVFMPERDYNLPIGPGPGYAVWQDGNVRTSGSWSRDGGNIFVIKDIESLLDPENLKMIIS